MTTALSGVALLVRRAANDRVIRQQHPARKYAMVACNHHAGIALDTFRLIRTGDPLSRRRFRCGLAAFSRGRCHRRALFRHRAFPIPTSCDAGLIRPSGSKLLLLFGGR
jgi:hypothetical protein